MIRVNGSAERRSDNPLQDRRESEAMTTDDIGQLEKRRDELTERLAAIKRDLGRGLERDLEEQAVQLENLEVLQEIERIASEELREIELKLLAAKAKR
jgi:hypothetical protein